MTIAGELRAVLWSGDYVPAITHDTGSNAHIITHIDKNGEESSRVLTREQVTTLQDRACR